ncbi:MAG: hypothetical protein IT290_04720 [Deltaproteobacteria bacterium]|nr:hypothetical protein [Deltaproteobacteria bacterium]
MIGNPCVQDVIVGSLCASAPEQFRNATPWGALAKLGDYVAERVRREQRDGEQFIHPTAIVESGAVLKGAVYISAGAFVAAGAYLRGGVFLGERVRVGPGCEVKSSLIMSDTRLAHFNFVGDSIVGSDVNFEAGALVANHWNERSDKTIVVATARGTLSTGVTKFGAFIGDGARIGANAVLSPGTLLAPGSVIPRLALVEQVRDSER